MQTALAQYPYGWTENRWKTPLAPRAAHGRGGSRQSNSSAVIFVRDATHLCRVQSTTRELCRAIGQNESTVFQAVIAMTELAYHLFVESSHSGVLEVSAVKRKNGLGLEVRAENGESRGLPPHRMRLSYRLAAMKPS
jgi:hypothetical protein